MHVIGLEKPTCPLWERKNASYALCTGFLPKLWVQTVCAQAWTTKDFHVKRLGTAVLLFMFIAQRAIAIKQIVLWPHAMSRQGIAPYYAMAMAAIGAFAHGTRDRCSC